MTIRPEGAEIFPCGRIDEQRDRHIDLTKLSLFTILRHTPENERRGVYNTVKCVDRMNN